MTDKRAIYERFFEANQSELPIFFWPKWLDAVSSGQWDFVYYGKPEQPLAVFPFRLYKKGMFRLLANPLLTPYLGPWLQYPDDQKYTTRLSFERKVIKDLIDQLPKFDYCAVQTHPGFTNWLPFYWEGFDQTTRYTFRLSADLIKQGSDIWASPVKRSLNKADKLLRIETISIDTLWHLVEATFARQKMKPPYPKTMLDTITKWLVQESRTVINGAVDQHGRCHAAHVVIWDDQFIYGFKSAADPNLRDSRAQTLLYNQAFELAHKKGLSFDFQGSMIKSIERSFAQYGGKQTPYFEISKANGWKGRLVRWRLK